MKRLLKRFLIENYKKNARFILLKFRYKMLEMLKEKWFRLKLSDNFSAIAKELKDGNGDNFVFHLQGGGSSYQRRKQRRLIMRNIVANYYNYSDRP